MTPDQLERLRNKVPQIAPSPPGDRPFFSVVIPTFNRPDLLAETLRSVLNQAAAPEAMQISVIDDASPGNTTREVVASIGGDRVEYVRQSENVGQWRNVNAGIQHTRGLWVHVLHDDDWVEPGFYAAVRQSVESQRDPAIGTVFTAIATHRPEGARIRLWPLQRAEPGVLRNWLDVAATSSWVQTPAVIVRRNVYETLGGYNPAFAFPADWEMWQRIASHYRWWYEPRAVACYRVQSESVTNRSRRTGSNIAEIRQVIDFAQDYLPPAIAPVLKEKALRYWSLLALKTARRMVAAEDYETASAQIIEALRTHPSRETVWALLNLKTRAP